MINKYNKIATVYYPLSKLFFGNSLYQIQEQLFIKAPPQNDLLILGGGMGQILPFLHKTCPQLEITFVDASSKMISMARRNAINSQRISFTHSDRYMEDRKFHNIMLPFFLDILDENELNWYLKAIKHMSFSDTRIYLTDFYQPYTSIQKLKLKLSILFFKITTGLKSNDLPDVFDLMLNNNYKLLEDCRLQNGFIRGSILTSSSY